MDRELKYCPFCGEEIDLNAKKCKYCKEWLVETGEKSYEQTKHCQFCGCEVPITAEKCVYCGEWLIREEDNNYENGDGYILSAIIWTPIILCLIGCLMYCFLPMPEVFKENMSSDDYEVIQGICFLAALLLPVVGLILEIYFYPTRVALNKMHNNKLIVFLINLFFGGTIVGWIFSLIIASSQRRGRNSIL